MCSCQKKVCGVWSSQATIIRDYFQWGKNLIDGVMTIYWSDGHPPIRVYNPTFDSKLLIKRN